MMTDPIADMFTRIRNGQAAAKTAASGAGVDSSDHESESESGDDTRSLVKIMPPKKSFDGSEDKFVLWRRMVTVWKNRYPGVPGTRLGSYLLDAIEGDAEELVLTLLPEGEETYDQIMKILDQKYGDNALTKCTVAITDFRKLKRGKRLLKDFLNIYDVARAKCRKYGWKPSEETDGADLLAACELPSSQYASVIMALTNNKDVGPTGLPDYEATRAQMDLLAQSLAIKDSTGDHVGDHRRKRPAMFAAGEPAPKAPRADDKNKGGKGGGGKGSCWDFQKGKCHRGNTCKFNHGNSGKKGPSDKGKGKGWAGKGPSKQPCRQFLAGTCTRGSNCWFSHANREGHLKIEDAPSGGGKAKKD